MLCTKVDLILSVKEELYPKCYAIGFILKSNSIRNDQKKINGFLESLKGTCYRTIKQNKDNRYTKLIFFMWFLSSKENMNKQNN